MQKILTAAEMRRDDEAKIQSGTPSRILMERAAEAVLQILQRDFDISRVLVLCGGETRAKNLHRLLEERGIRDIAADSAAATREEIGNDIYPPMGKALREAGVTIAESTQHIIDILIGMRKEGLV